MSPVLLSLAIVVGFFCAYMAAHAVVFRIFLPKLRWVALRRMFILFLPFVIGFAWVYAPTEPGAVESDLVGAFVLLGLIHNGYLMVYAFVDRSISIRINTELFRAGNTALGYQALRNRYDPGDSVRRRLEILRAAGFLSCSDNHYTLTPKGKFVAKGVRWVKLFLRLGPGG